MPEADGRGRRAMDAWFAPPKPEFKKISLDSPWGSVPLPGEGQSKGLKFPAQRADKAPPSRLDGASVNGR